MQLLFIPTKSRNSSYLIQEIPLNVYVSTETTVLLNSHWRWQLETLLFLDTAKFPDRFQSGDFAPGNTRKIRQNDSGKMEGLHPAAVDG